MRAVSRRRLKRGQLLLGLGEPAHGPQGGGQRKRRRQPGGPRDRCLREPDRELRVERVQRRSRRRHELLRLVRAAVLDRPHRQPQPVLLVVGVQLRRQLRVQFARLGRPQGGAQRLAIERMAHAQSCAADRFDRRQQAAGLERPGGF